MDPHVHTGVYSLQGSFRYVILLVITAVLRGTHYHYSNCAFVLLIIDSIETIIVQCLKYFLKRSRKLELP